MQKLRVLHWTRVSSLKGMMSLTFIKVFSTRTHLLHILESMGHLLLALALAPALPTVILPQLAHNR